MPTPDKVDDLINEIRELVKKLDKPKSNTQGWLTIVTSFLASVVIAGLSLYYSNKQSVRSAEERKQNFLYNRIRDSLEAENKRENLRVEELKALRDLIPSLASKDSLTRAIAIQLLKASTGKDSTQIVSKYSNNDHAGQQKAPVLISGITAKTSIIDNFYTLLSIAQSTSQPEDKRLLALKATEPLFVSGKISDLDKKKGLTIVSEIATASGTPESVKRTAESVIANIKQISLEQLPKILSSEQVTRPITDIILHHVGYPFTSANFKGASTIFAIAKHQTSELNWNRVSWHYAIAPDGSIWLGMPLNEMAIHAREHNKSSVAILLIVDGDKELPTPQQNNTLSSLLKLLFTKLHLQPQSLHPHRFFDQMKSCPGKLITDEYISGFAK